MKKTIALCHIKSNLMIVLILLTALAFLSSCGKFQEDYISDTDPSAEEETRERPMEALQGTGAQVSGSAVESLVCPIDGMPVNEIPARAIAITIDNYKAARPQSGLDKADLIYEVPVEGGLTRYLAIYYHGQADIIGPIRSARPYLIDIAREWDAVYIHVGQSPQAQIYFKRTGIEHINEMFHPSGFWRDKSRRAPHNLYSSTGNLWKEIIELGWAKQTEINGYDFRTADAEAGGSMATTISIPYYYGEIGYRYDRSSGKYLRYLNGEPYMDLQSGAQLAASNVLVQKVSIRAFDAEGRLEIDLVGEGEAILFSDGYAEKGFWKKDAVTERTIFCDGSGREFKIKAGQTWIQLVPVRIEVDYQ